MEKKIVGESERLYLREMVVEDTENIVRWRNAPHVVKNFIYRKPLTVQDHLNWIENKIKPGLVRQFVICKKGSDEGFGSIYFRDIDNDNHTCEFGIFIGEPDCAGKGYGFESQKISMTVAFEEMHMEEVHLRVLESNIAAIKNYKKCGFVLTEGEEEYTEDGEKVLFMKAVKPVTNQ